MISCKYSVTGQPQASPVHDFAVDLSVSHVPRNNDHFDRFVWKWCLEITAGTLLGTFLPEVVTDYQSPCDQSPCDQGYAFPEVIVCSLEPDNFVEALLTSPKSFVWCSDHRAG